MKRPGKPCPRKKDLRFWPHHRIDLEELERRFYPGSVIDLFGWSLLGSPLAFLGASFSRESQTSASADALDSSCCVPHSAFSLLPSDPTPLPWALLSLTISAPPAENAYASNLPTQPANDSATVPPGLSLRSPGELRDPFAELFGDDGEPGRPKLMLHGSDAETVGRTHGGGDGAVPLFVHENNDGHTETPMSYENTRGAGYDAAGLPGLYPNASVSAADGTTPTSPSPAAGPPGSTAPPGPETTANNSPGPNPSSQAQPPCVTDFKVSHYEAAESITLAANGTLWFTESGNYGLFPRPSIGEITPAGMSTEFALPGESPGDPYDLVAGPDGAIWFTEKRANKIGRITQSGVIREFTVPTSNSWPEGISAGPDGALWFTEYNGNKIGRISLAGGFTEFSLPSTSSSPANITSGPDGNLWFTESNAYKIGQITTAGVVTEFATSAYPFDIAADARPGGYIWFTEGNKVGRMLPGGSLTEFTLPNYDYASSIVVDADGIAWFTIASGGSRKQLGRITPLGAITEFAFPTQNLSVTDIASGSDGNIWLTIGPGIEIARFAPTSSSFAVFPSLTASVSVFSGITTGPDGAVWFTETSAIGRISPAGVLNHFPISVSPAYLTGGIVTGPDGNLWFTEYDPLAYDGGIGRITTSGTFTDFGRSTGLTPRSITNGVDGNLWFTDLRNNTIGRITTAGVIATFAIPTSYSGPGGIALGLDGNLWFTEGYANKIGQITPNGVIHEFSIPTSSSGPSAIAAGPDGNLWFAEYDGNKIGKITLGGTITEYSLPAYGSPSAITAGSDGNLYFVGYLQGQLIGRITTTGTISPYALPTSHGVYPYELTAGPDGALWFTAYAEVGKVAPCVVERLNDTSSTWFDATTASVAPNTGTLRISQPFDVRQSQGSALDGLAGLGITPALVYNSDTIGVRPIAEVTASFNPSLGVPDQLTAQLTWKYGQSDQVIQDPVSFDPSRVPAGGTYLLDTRLNNSAPNTGRYPWRVHVHAHFPGGATAEREFFDNAQTRVTDNAGVSSFDDSPFAPGWSLAGLNRLVPVTSTINGPNGVLMVFGSGQASHYFDGNLDTSFTSPPNDFGTLSQPGGQGSTYTYVSKDHVTWTYDSNGFLRTITDPHNLSVTFTYQNDSMGTQRLLNTIQLPDGGMTTFNYDSATNLLTSVHEPGGRNVMIGRNANRDIQTITNPDGGVRTFSYDSSHHLTNQQWGPTSATYPYDPATGVVNGVDWGLDNGRPTRLNLTPANIQGLQTQAQAAPALAAVTDADTNLNTYTLDGLGRINQLDRPGIPSETWQRDQAGQVTVYTDARGNAVTNTYDYNNSTATYTYGSGNGDLTRIDYPDTTNQQFQYESLYHHLTQRQDQRGKFTTFLYDSVGNLTGTRDANQNLTQQQWYGPGPFNGLLSSVTDANGHATTYQYDPSGNRRLIGMTEATGYNESRYSTYLQDAAGNVTSMTGGQSIITTYAHAVTTTSSYDGMRRRTGVTEGSGARSSTTLYDAVGNITQTIDAAGRTTNFIYNNRNLLIETDEAVATTLVARSTTYLYDGAGNVLARTDGIAGNANYAHPVTTSYGYDALNRRTQTIEGFNSTTPRSTATLYDAAGNITQITDANTHATQFLYDALNRKTVTIDATPEHNRTTIGYDPVGNITSVQAPLSRYTTYAYDPVNRRTEVTEGINDATIKRTTTTLYDAVGNTTGMIYPRQFGTPPQNLRVTYVYDALNRQTAMFDMANQRSLTAYDATSNVVSSTDVLGRQMTYSYDALNQRREMTEAAQLPAGDPLRRSTTTVYDAVGNVTGVYSPLIPGRNNLTQFRYDELNRRTLTTDPAGQQTQTLYDATSNVTASYDEVSRLTAFQYDALNQRIQMTEAAGTSLARLTTTLYDAVGNVTGVRTPAVVGTMTRLTSYAYDNLNRRTEVTESAHLAATVSFERRTTTTQYDALGNSTGMIDPDGNATTYMFDVLNRKTVTIGPALDPGTGANVRATMLYDAADNVTQITDRDSRVRKFLYDALDRRTNEVWQTSPSLTTFTYNYDGAGQLTGTSDPFSNYSFSPDALGRATNITFVGGLNVPIVLNQDFNAADERIDVKASINGVNDYRNDYGYDAVSRLTSVAQSTQSVGNPVAYKRVKVGYAPDSQIQEIDRYFSSSDNDLVAQTLSTGNFDALARLRQSTHQNQRGLNIQYNWDFDVGDRLTLMRNTGEGTSTYLYDANDQVTGGTYGFGQNPENYGYNRNGNRTAANGSTYAPPSTNRLQSDGTFTYRYDNEGNRISRLAGSDVTTYTWDFRNRLIEEQRSGGPVTYDVHYTYDIFDRRIAKVVTGVSTRLYSYDGDNLNFTFDVVAGTPVLTHRYLYGDEADQLFTDEQLGGSSPGNRWALPDQLGSVRDVVGDTGSVQSHFQYTVYGQPVGPQQPTQDAFAFQGREFEITTALYYFRARYYDPVTGSFLSEDPAGDGTNPFRFLGNNPTGATDPYGLVKQLVFQARGNGTVDIYQEDTGMPGLGEGLFNAALGCCGPLGAYWAASRVASRLESPVLYIGYMDPSISTRVLFRKDVPGYVGLYTLIPSVKDESITNGKTWFQANAKAPGEVNTATMTMGINGSERLFADTGIGSDTLRTLNGAERLDRLFEIAQWGIPFAEGEYIGAGTQTLIVGGATVVFRGLRALRTAVTPLIVKDPGGRITSVSARITPANLYGGTGTTAAARAAAAPDDAGHILGKLLGGRGGATSDNIFAQLPSINRGAFRQHEAWVASQVKAGRKVYVDIQLIYPNASSTRPARIRYTTIVNGVKNTHIFGN